MLESGNDQHAEQKEYQYSLQDVSEPNLYRLLYSYNAPKIPFNHRHADVSAR